MLAWTILTEDNIGDHDFESATTTTPPITTYAPSTSTTIVFYLLRYAYLNEDWKIQVVFNNDLKFDFQTSKTLVQRNVS